jgi:hypothetical protein
MEIQKSNDACTRKKNLRILGCLLPFSIVSQKRSQNIDVETMENREHRN